MIKTFYRLFTLAAVIMTCMLYAFAIEFSDVQSNSWYKSYVDYAAGNGLINGTGDGYFSPDKEFTVAQCLTVAARIHSSQFGNELKENSGENWYDCYKDYCIDNKIISPQQFSGNFNRSITREETVNVLINAVKSDFISKTNNVSGICDVASDDDSFDNILKFYNAGILAGSDSVGSFLPSSSIKRSEIAAILCRLINKDMRIQADIPYVGSPRYLIDDVVMKGKWGLQSGWNYDHKYSLDNTKGLNSFSIGANFAQTVNINRPINPTDKGYVVFDTNVTFTVCENGGYVSICDPLKNDIIKVVSKQDFFVIICGDNITETKIPVCNEKSITHTFIFRFDLENDYVNVTIDNTDFEGISIPKNTSVARLYIGHDGSGMGVVTVESARCTADYRICENFLSNDLCEGLALYGSWETSGDVTLSKILSERNADVFSAKMTNKSVAGHSFEKIGGKFIFEANILFPDVESKGDILVTKENNVIAKITYNDGSYCAEGNVLRKVPKNIWTNLYIEADCLSKKAVIRINGKICGEIPFNTDYIDGIKFANNGNIMWFDDVRVYQTFDRDDYPSTPLAVNDDNYEIGVNVCNLWRNGHCDEGYNAVAPFEELYPLIGLADEGLPELADWENKQMAEHGIDFQHICWYAPQAVTTAPVKATSMPQLALNDGYLKSKYGDYVKFCIMWENANGAVTDFQQFKDYIWPYFVEYYFTDDRYYTIDNKPLMTIWSYKKFISSFGGEAGAKKVLDFMREEIKRYGFDGMIIWLGGGSTLANGLSIGADAVYPYNYGTSGESGAYQISMMNTMRSDGALHYVPGVSVGFNAIGRHDKRTGMISDREHEQVCEYIKNDYLPSVKATGEDSWKNNTLIVSTWNEYTEGTYVAPNNLCGFDYIDNIRKYFTYANEDHEDIIPSDKVKDRLRNLYPDGFSPIRRFRLEENENIVEKLMNSGISIIKWDFSKEADRNQWRESHGIDEFSKTSTSIHGKTEQKDYGIMLDGNNVISLDVEETGAYYLHIRMKSDKISTSQLFFKYYDTSDLSEDKSVSWLIEDTDRYIDYYIDLSKNLLWTGVIGNLRFDPMTIGGEFDIELIEFLAIPKEEYTQICFDSNIMRFDFTPTADEKTGEILVTANPRLGFFTMSHTCYEFDIDKGQVYIESLNGNILLTFGSNIAIVNGKEVDLGYTIEQRDGLPVIPLKKVMTLLGFSYTEGDNYINFDTMDKTLKEAAIERRVGAWEFNSIGNMSGWQMQNCSGHVTDGNFNLTTGGSDTAILCTNLDINLVKTGFKTITVGIKYQCDRDEIIPQIFFVAGNESTFNEKASVRLSKTSGSSDGKTIEFIFDMSQNDRWFGHLSKLRFDPFNGNGTYSIDYIRLS